MFAELLATRQLYRQARDTNLDTKRPEPQKKTLFMQHQHAHIQVLLSK